MASPESKSSGWKEVVGKVGIAGGIVAGALGLLAQNSGLFVLGLLGVGGGYYLHQKK